MKNKSSKTYVKQLVRREGSEGAVATLLGITPRYVKMLLAGRAPGESLRRLIKMVLK